MITKQQKKTEESLKNQGWVFYEFLACGKILIMQKGVNLVQIRKNGTIKQTK